MPSLPPKCSYTTGLDTLALAAISSTEVPSKPLSANRARPTWISCSRRSAPVMRLRDREDSLTGSIMAGVAARTRFGPVRLCLAEVAGRTGTTTAEAGAVRVPRLAGAGRADVARASGEEGTAAGDVGV